MEPGVLRFSDSPRGFCWMGLPDALACISTLPAMFGICYWLSLVLPEKVITCLCHPSVHVNQYYNISWVLIMFVPFFFTGTNDWHLALTWLVVILLTILGVVIYNKWMRDTVEDICGRHPYFWTAVVWIISMTFAIYAFASYSAFPNVFSTH